jgi:acetylornithine deacetylase/succinyl-diaminopimelate desuccinylase-like protein
MPSQPSLDSLKTLYQVHCDKVLEEFFTFLRFKSISSENEYQPQLIACANWVVDYLNQMGFHTELWQTTGHPVVYASLTNAGPDKPTLLIYNHYDVQPVDPLELWNSPPFEPTIREGQIFARGAADNKGQCFYVLQALKLLLRKHRKLPINIKLCIEGEEEVGSGGLSEILSKKQKELKADYLAIVDLGIPDLKTPALTLGVRGIVTMDVKAQGSTTDLHSGSHGGIAYNPIHALNEIFGDVRDKAGRITIPGFYDQVCDISSKDKSKLKLNFDSEDYLKTFGAYPTGGEKNLSPLERIWLRPTIEVNGICGGYTGKGFKTVIPALAFAKVSCRLVPDQEPQVIGKLVANYIESKAPEGIKITVEIHPGSGCSVRAEIFSPVVQAFNKAYAEVFQTPVSYVFAGGSIPIIKELREASQSSVIMLGLGLPDDFIHAPNEHFGIDRLQKGALIMARAIEILGNA